MKKIIIWILLSLLLASMTVLRAKDIEPPVIEPITETVIEPITEQETETVTEPTTKEQTTAEPTTKKQEYKSCCLSKELQNAIYETCNETGLPLNVAYGLIEVESNFNAYARNPKTGCYGLCQLNPKYFPSGLSPKENVRAGLKCLGKYYNKTNGDIAKALTMYNAGYDNGSRSYANKVLNAAEKWG